MVAFLFFKIFESESFCEPSSLCPIETITVAGLEDKGIKYEKGAALMTPFSWVTIQAIGLGTTVSDISLYLFMVLSSL